MDLKKVERISWRPVIYSTVLNLAGAAIAFSVSFSFFGYSFLTVFWTLVTWAATVTFSFGYWMIWFFKKIRHISGKMKVGFAALMIALLSAVWAIILSVLQSL